MRTTPIKVTGLYRYPVKSMGGVRVDALQIASTGPVGDRNWAVIEADSHAIRNAKRWPALLGFRARYLEEPIADAYGDAVSTVEIEAPGGGICRSDEPRMDAWLSEQLGRSVHLSPRQPAYDRAHYRLSNARTDAEIAAELDLLDGEVLPNFAASNDALVAQLQVYATPPGSYVDSFPVHLITQNALERLQARCGLDISVERFRPNLLLVVEDKGGEAELGWIGFRLAIGGSVLAIRSPTLRCAMPSRAQPLLGLKPEPALTRALVDHCDRLLGVNATVEQAGIVQRGDIVRVLKEEKTQ